MTRQQQVAQERRRRSSGTLDASANAKLAIPDEVKARLQAEGLTPRWINDEGNRIHNLSVKDDYDKVDGVEPVPVADGVLRRARSGAHYTCAVVGRCRSSDQPRPIPDPGVTRNANVDAHRTLRLSQSWH